MIASYLKEVQVRVSAFPYYKNSVQLFRCIAHRPYAIFLDSGTSYGGHGRFDILSADPKEVFTPQNSHIDPFTACQQILSKYTMALPHSLPELPFTIGAIGYFAYDAGRLLETLPNIAKNDIDLPDVCIGFYDWSLIIDHHQQTSWLITSHPK